eukprot:5758351-Pleurochrysis_carterae.AAC.3
MFTISGPAPARAPAGGDRLLPLDQPGPDHARAGAAADNLQPGPPEQAVYPGNQTPRIGPGFVMSRTSARVPARKTR